MQFSFFSYFLFSFITINRNRFDIKYNHNNTHDLKSRIKNRTTLKSIQEFNDLLNKSFNELFKENLIEIRDNGSYSLYLKEYNFSIIINMDYKYKIIFVKTIMSGIASTNVRNVIELKSTL